MSFISWAKTPLGLGTIALAAYYLYTETVRGKDVGDKLYGAGQEFFEEGKHFVKTTLDTVIDTGESIFGGSVGTVEDVVDVVQTGAESATDDLLEAGEMFLADAEGFIDDTLGFNGSSSNDSSDNVFSGFSAEFGEL